MGITAMTRSFRISDALVLVAAGLGGLVATRRSTGATLEAVASSAVVLTGFVVVFGPWWLALVRDLTVERRERVRSAFHQWCRRAAP